MKSRPCAPLSALSRMPGAGRNRSPLPLLTIPAALCLLTACAADRVVVKPLMAPPVAPELLRPVAKPFCELSPGAESYSGPELSAVIDCWRSAWTVASGKHDKLATAVKIREAAVQSAVRAAVR